MSAIEQLDLSDLRVLDGGMATELEKRGCDLAGPLWSARVLRETPEIVEAVHDSYLAAGADCILTASYQVSAEAFIDVGLSAAEAEEAAARSLRESVRLAENSRARFAQSSSRRISIAASLGPYGAALHNGAEYHGNYVIPFEQLIGFHARRLAVLAETGADWIAFETVPSLEEARAIVAALELYPQVGAWVSFTCRDGSRVAHGESIAECAALLDSARQVIAVGVNCTAPSLLVSLIGQVRSATRKPIVVYPNSGETWDGAARRWVGNADPGDFAGLVSEWRQAGAQIIGGCCRTGPAHVAQIREAIS